MAIARRIPRKTTAWVPASTTKLLNPLRRLRLEARAGGVLTPPDSTEAATPVPVPHETPEGVRGVAVSAGRSPAAGDDEVVGGAALRGGRSPDHDEHSGSEGTWDRGAGVGGAALSGGSSPAAAGDDEHAGSEGTWDQHDGDSPLGDSTRFFWETPPLAPLSPRHLPVPSPLRLDAPIRGLGVQRPSRSLRISKEWQVLLPLNASAPSRPQRVSRLAARAARAARAAPGPIDAHACVAHDSGAAPGPTRVGLPEPSLAGSSPVVAGSSPVEGWA
jgi:hypothetical protein